MLIQGYQILHTVPHSQSAKCTVRHDCYNCMYQVLDEGCPGRDRMVDGFATTFAISAHHH